MELVISLNEEDMEELRTGGRVFIKMDPRRKYDNFQMVVVKTDDAVYPMTEWHDDDVICEKCGGTGFSQMAPNARGIKRCDACGGTGTINGIKEEK